MVRFCNKCKRAVDDTDKFCRACGYGTDDSIDYQTYYNLFEKSDNVQQSSYWFNIGKDLAIRQELADIRAKVDIMYEKLFPSPIKELMANNEKIIEIDNKDEKISVPEHQYIKVDENPTPEHSDIKVEETPAPEHSDIKVEETKDNKNPNLISVKELLEKKCKKNENEWTWKVEDVPETQDIKVENTPEPQDIKDVHEEADAKLGALLGPEDKGQRDALRYLIHKYSKKDNNSGEESVHKDVKTIDKNVITIIPKEDITREHTRGRGKGETRSIYHDAIFKFIPDILKEIEHSNDGRIRVKISDIAEKMGEQFVGKKNVTIYTGLKYSLFAHNIIVEQGTLKEIDPITHEGIKVLIMRMKNPDDKLPPSKLRRKGKFVEINIDDRIEEKV